MIKTGGENVASREVEEAIFLHPAVQEVAVVGLNHPRWVEAVAAEITEHCRKNLSSFKVPKKILFVEALPKTPTGKILKRQMRESFKEIFS